MELSKARFTDEDLKRLKERIAEQRYGISPAQMGVRSLTLSVESLESLIARLEAAEQFCELANKLVIKCGHMPDGWWDVVKAAKEWRKAAGI